MKILHSLEYQFQTHYKHNLNYFLIRPRAISHLASQHTWWQNVVAWLVIKFAKVCWYWANGLRGTSYRSHKIESIHSLLFSLFIFWNNFLSFHFWKLKLFHQHNSIDWISLHHCSCMLRSFLFFPGSSHIFKTSPTTLLIPSTWLSLLYFALFLIIHMNLI